MEITEDIIQWAIKEGACAEGIERARRGWESLRPSDRRWLAHKHSAPGEVLAKLADDDDVYVRIGVARNPSTPLEVLVKLAEDNHNYVRYWVAQHPSMPAEVLAKLANDANANVRQAAQERLSR